MVKNIVYKLYKYIYFCVSINLKKFIKINIIYDYFLLWDIVNICCWQSFYYKNIEYVVMVDWLNNNLL